VLPTVFAICSRRQSDCSRHGTMPGNVGTRLPSLKWSLCNYDGPIAVIETWHCVPSGLMPCLPHLADICQFVRLASCLSRQQFFRSTNGYPSSLVLPIRFRLVTNSVKTEPGLPLLVSVRRSQRLAEAALESAMPFLQPSPLESDRARSGTIVGIVDDGATSSLFILSDGLLRAAQSAPVRFMTFEHFFGVLQLWQTSAPSLRDRLLQLLAKACRSLRGIPVCGCAQGRRTFNTRTRRRTS